MIVDGVAMKYFPGAWGSIAFPMGTTTLNCIATDYAGNVATDSFTVTVVLEEAADTTPPTWIFVMASLDNTTVTRTALNSTGYNFYWHAVAIADGSTYANGCLLYTSDAADE